MNEHEKINYVEFASTNLLKTKRFIPPLLIGSLKISVLTTLLCLTKVSMLDLIVPHFPHL
jgi:hypothetical protein